MKKQDNIDVKELLSEKKVKDGKLSPLGEWLLSDDRDKLHLDLSDLTSAQQQRFWRLAMK